MRSEIYNYYPKHYCGLFGIYGHKDASRLTYLGLYSLQHRGEESAGIASSDGENIYQHKGMGLVGDVFNEERLDALPGNLAIGHVRYSTTGSSLLKNAQPLLVNYSRGSVAICHNGNLVNARRLRDELEAYGSIFQTTTDSEIIIHLLAKSRHKNFEDNLIDALKQVRGAYSLLLMTEDQVIAVRDPNGFRPLCIGKLQDAYVISSETCALDLIEAEFIREVEPGEIVFLNSSGLRSVKPFPKCRISQCIFEHVYFARPDSRIFGENVHLVRQNLGIHLAREHPQDADIVMPIPDSGFSAALGFSHESGIPFERGLIRNHYVGRTFIQPSQIIRDFNVKIKLNPVKDILKNKRVVVIDDSIVRGTTSKMRLKSIRKAGAKEIHMRVSCPPHKYPCYYGIDFPTQKELIAANRSTDGIKEFLGVDSLGYLSIEGLLGSSSGPRENYCTCCYTGDYPVPLEDAVDKYIMEEKRRA